MMGDLTSRAHSSAALMVLEEVQLTLGMANLCSCAYLSSAYSFSPVTTPGLHTSRTPMMARKGVKGGKPQGWQTEEGRGMGDGGWTGEVAGRDVGDGKQGCPCGKASNQKVDVGPRGSAALALPPHVHRAVPPIISRHAGRGRVGGGGRYRIAGGLSCTRTTNRGCALARRKRTALGLREDGTA